MADDWDAMIDELRADENMLESARSDREGRINSAPGSELESLPRHPVLSPTPISQRAHDLIIMFEVTSQAVYTLKYQRPIWPKGASGVTVGVGYDVGYVDPNELGDDWQGAIDDAMIAKLVPACGVTGQAAGNMLSGLQSVVVPWNAAEQVFSQRTIPKYVGQTEGALPNTNLLTEDSLGALVSLDYNRGPSFSIPPEKDPTNRYREMRAIKAHMVAKEFAQIPDELRSMKRLWAGNPDMAGLLKRRELEAVLFERGLATT